MSLVMQNNQTIERAFRNATMRAEQSIQRALEQLLNWGMEECLTRHDDVPTKRDYMSSQTDDEVAHGQHLIVDKGYGWVLFKNGSVVAKGIKSQGGYPQLQVDVILNDLQSEANPVGWSGFVVACMEGLKWKWSDRFEIAVQTSVCETISLMGRQFEDIFKPMPRG